jgi:hypothetical protein
MRIWPFLFLLVLVVWGCKPTQPTTGVQQDGKYSEDLSGLRPRVEESTETVVVTPDKNKRDPKAYVEPQHTVNKQLDTVLDSIDRINLTRKFVEGYTIQVYLGMKREDALNVKKQLTISLPQLESELQYQQPNYRVKTGKYFTRLEAEKDYAQVKQYFQAAILVPDKIAIN